MESVILSSPLLAVLYAIALIVSVYGLKNPKGTLLPSISIIICLLTSGYAILKGASIFEIVTILLIFLAVNLLIFAREEGDK